MNLRDARQPVLASNMHRPDISHLLNSNSPPNPAELAAVRADYDAALKEIHRLRSNLSAQRGVLSPLRCMPLEILGLIFFFTETINPMSLGLVCKRWREATLSRHDLWTHVSAPPNADFNKIATWFRRSGTVPKSLYAWTPTHGPCRRKTCSYESSALVKMLTEGPATLQEFSISPQSARCFKRFISALEKTSEVTPSRPWDNLRSLEVAFWDSDEMEWEEEDATTMFMRLPLVESLSINLPSHEIVFDSGEEAIVASLNISAPVLANLTSLTFGWDWAGPQFVTALGHCVKLETLELDVKYSDMFPTVLHWTTPPHLPRLRTMRLRHHGSLEILGHIETPTIEELDIGLDGTQYASARNDEPFKIFATRFSKTIRSLRLYDFCITPEQLAAILDMFSDLTHFQLDRVKIDHEDFWPLMQEGIDDVDGVKRTYLPRLDHLEVLQVDREYTLEIFGYVGRYLKSKGPHQVHVDVSFQDAPHVNPLPDEDDISRSWNERVSIEPYLRAKGAKSKGSVSREQFGASFKVVPCIDHGDE